MKRSWLRFLHIGGATWHRDDFGDALGLDQAQNEQIRGFWPAQGPQWDGLAVLTSAAFARLGLASSAPLLDRVILVFPPAK